jgi:uncharacterized membrane protein YfcA
MPMTLLAILFLLVALAYSAVGFGGGSSYSAILVLSGTDFRVLPAISLTCNIVVVSGGVYHFHKAGHLELRKLLPFVALSVPLAWLGGNLQVSESIFVGLLGMALLITGCLLLLNPVYNDPAKASPGPNSWALGLPLGAAIGFLSGVIGIGGGIFLAPVLYLSGWGQARSIAAMSSGFILVNSMAGLAGHLMKQGSYSITDAWISAWPLFLAVLAGGQIGSRLASKSLPEKWIQRLTAGLILYVALRLVLKWFELTAA